MNIKLSTLKTLKLLTSISCFLVISCSTNDDMVDKVKQKLSDEIMSQSNNSIVLSSIEKLDGNDMEINSAKYYDMDIKAVIKFQKEVWKAGNSVDGYFSNFSIMEQKPQ